VDEGIDGAIATGVVDVTVGGAEGIAECAEGAGKDGDFAGGVAAVESHLDDAGEDAVDGDGGVEVFDFAHGLVTERAGFGVAKRHELAIVEDAEA
jgi:hypothetical protein